MINQLTLDLIVEFEGFVKTWYRDPVGVWTVGYGHTDAAGAPFYKDTKNKVFSLAEGRKILQNDLIKYEVAVARLFKGVSLNENQYGALVSFCYNLGPGNLEKSTLRKKILAKDFLGAADEFLKWNKAGGKVLAGLTRRRKAERALFLTPAGSSQPLPTKDEPKPETPEKSSNNILSLLLQILRKIFS